MSVDIYIMSSDLLCLWLPGPTQGHFKTNVFVSYPTYTGTPYQTSGDYISFLTEFECKRSHCVTHGVRRGRKGSVRRDTVVVPSGNVRTQMSIGQMRMLSGGMRNRGGPKARWTPYLFDSWWDLRGWIRVPRSSTDE